MHDSEQQAYYCSGHKPLCDKCKSKMEEKIKVCKLKQMKKIAVRQKEAQACSIETHVAPLPRMLSDSGRVMTGIRCHSESERAGATLQTEGTPFISSKQATQPAPPGRRFGVLPLVPTHPFICASIPMLDTYEYQQWSSISQCHSGVMCSIKGHAHTKTAVA